jgi:hypothetical protein
MVVYTIRRTGKPFFPGQFFSGGFFQRGFAFEDARINITLPKSTAAHVEVQGVVHQLTEGEQTTTHSFLYRNPRPPMAEATGLSAWDTDPRFIISTFADYAALAAAYRGLANEKAAVTPRIQAVADDITAGASDRREQAHRIYDWVSEHIRCVPPFSMKADRRTTCDTFFVKSCQTRHTLRRQRQEPAGYRRLGRAAQCRWPQKCRLPVAGRPDRRRVSTR